MVAARVKRAHRFRLQINRTGDISESQNAVDFLSDGVHLGKDLGFEAVAGIGAASTRFYSGSYTCTFITCTDYNSTTHFMGHIGGGVNIYVHGNFFIRPEAHLYFIHNNNEFSSGRVGRLGASLGYTF